jgi:hypothetical protein
MIRISKVRKEIGVTINMGDYSNLKLSTVVEAEIDEHESPEDAQALVFSAAKEAIVAEINDLLQDAPRYRLLPRPPSRRRATRKTKRTSRTGMTKTRRSRKTKATTKTGTTKTPSASWTATKSRLHPTRATANHAHRSANSITSPGPVFGGKHEFVYRDFQVIG